QDLLGPRVRPLVRGARPLHLQHAHSPVGARGRLAPRVRRLPAPSGARAARRARGRPRGRRVIRIGEVAELTGVTPRTIRYYEEIGLLAGGERRKGEHRAYDESDVERLKELTRLRDLLNISLD